MRTRRQARCDAGVAMIAALVLLAAVVLRAAPAAAAEKAIWGPVTLPDGSSAFSLYEELGVDTLQLTLSWADIAPRRPAAATDPSDPAYRWPAEIAFAEAEAVRRGVRLALLVIHSPPWSNGGRTPVWAPDDAQDFADFMTAAARRYRSVRRWMIWGEPNRADRFQPNRDNNPIGPRRYATLLDAAYVALKRESPRNRVIGGMTWTVGTVEPPRFVRAMRLANGRRPRLDWFGHNPFPFRFPKLAASPVGAIRDISDSDTLSREVARAYGRRVPLWLSEYTIQSDHGSATFATFVSPASQARYVTAGFELADDLAGAVAGLGWFALLDEQPSPTSSNWGLLSHGLQRKAAFAAYAQAPGERHRPAVRVASSASRATLRGRGLPVGVTPFAGGAIVVKLHRGRRLLRRVRSQAAAGTPRTVRLRFAARAGRHTVSVRAPRGETVRRSLRVR